MRPWTSHAVGVADERNALAIERLEDGEVPPALHDVAQTGDDIELRGPHGGHLVRPCDVRTPVLPSGAGAGLAPLMAMSRHRRASGHVVPIALLPSSGTW